MRQRARRDANEEEIVTTLRQLGALVWRLPGTSLPGLPDLLCYFRGRWRVVEVKGAHGALTTAQRAVQRVTGFAVIRNTDEAIVWLLGPTA